MTGTTPGHTYNTFPYIQLSDRTPARHSLILLLGVLLSLPLPIWCLSCDRCAKGAAGFTMVATLVCELGTWARGLRFVLSRGTDTTSDC